MIATATAAAMTATRRHNSNAMAIVMDGNGQCNGNATIGKRLGKRILAQKCRDFDVANDIHHKLCNKYVMETSRTRSGWWWRPGADGGQKMTMEREMRP